MQKYKHIFFDLDKTLWDFDKNTAKTLSELIQHFNLNGIITDSEHFINRYHVHNDAVWDLFAMRKLNKNLLRTERFRLLLAEYNLHDEKLISQVDEYFMQNAPLKSALIEGSVEVLTHLYPGYSLYIVSNGFRETQLIKMKSAGIDHFFKRVFTSDQIGQSKPHFRFFEVMLSSSNARKRESLVIGDNFRNDVEGPALFGLDQVWFNPEGKTAEFKPKYEIQRLSELLKILP